VVEEEKYPLLMVEAVVEVEVEEEVMMDKMTKKKNVIASPIRILTQVLA